MTSLSHRQKTPRTVLAAAAVFIVGVALLLPRASRSATPAAPPTVSGRTVDERGRPLAGVFLQAAPLRPGGGPRASAISDGKGEFTLERLAPVDYRIEASDEGWARSVVNVRAPADKVVIGMEPGASLTVQLLDAQGARLTGKSEAEVRIRRVQEPAEHFDLDPDDEATGVFRQRGLRSGTYHVEATVPGHASLEAEVELGLGAKTSLELRLAAGQELGGEVVDGKGQPVPGAFVTASIAGVEVAATSDDRGRFRLVVSPVANQPIRVDLASRAGYDHQEVPAGTRSVRLVAGPHATAYARAHPQTPPAGVEGRLVAPDGSAPTRCATQLQSSQEEAVMVPDSRGALFLNWTLSFGFESQSARVSADGSFSLVLPPNRVGKTSWLAVSCAQGFAVIPLDSDNCTLPPTTLTPGATLVVRLPSRGDWTVAAQRGGMLLSREVKDADSLELTGLAPGKWTVGLPAPEDWRFGEVELRAGTRTELAPQ